MTIFQLFISLIIFILLEIMSSLLYKFGNKIPYILKFIIKFFVYVFSFIYFFVVSSNSNNLYVTFSINIIVITYANKYISLLSKKLDFGL